MGRKWNENLKDISQEKCPSWYKCHPLTYTHTHTHTHTHIHTERERERERERGRDWDRL
jgi:hypothetical protein